MRRPSGERTPFTRDDLDGCSSAPRAAPTAPIASRPRRLLPGKILGGFRYEGTRPDDPNDIVPHEHRRELRALRVFGAWTNLTDLKAGNTLDTLVTENGRGVVKHYLQDVGSTFGMAPTGRTTGTKGWEYFYEGGSTRRRLFSFGFALQPVADGVLRRTTRRSAASKATCFDPHDVEAAHADDGLHGDARRRRVLGGAPGDGVHRRDDSRGREDGPVQRSGRRAPPGRRC